MASLDQALATYPPSPAIKNPPVPAAESYINSPSCGFTKATIRENMAKVPQLLENIRWDNSY